MRDAAIGGELVISTDPTLIYSTRIRRASRFSAAGRLSCNEDDIVTERASTAP